MRVEGSVLIEITVNRSGEPVEIQALEGHPLLISATLEAAKQWRFQAYRVDGKAVGLSVRVKVIFVLKRHSGYRCKIAFPPESVHIRRGQGGQQRIPQKIADQNIWPAIDY